MFAELINEIAREDQEVRGPYYARPSSAGPEKCIRSLAYHALGEPPQPFPGRAILTMLDSYWHEELTKEWMAKTILQPHSQQMPIDIEAPGINLDGHYCTVCKKRNPPEVLHGHIDWLAFHPITTRDYLVEHKALSFFQCQRIEGGEYPWDNIVQSCIYSRGIQRDQPDCQDILLIIKNKNTAQYVEFEMVYDAKNDSLLIVKRLITQGNLPPLTTDINETHRDVVEKAIDKFRSVEKYKADRVLPARPFPYGETFPCGYCLWGAKCWEGYEASFGSLATDIALSEELETAARFYKELAAQESSAKKQKKEIRDAIIVSLDELGARSGRAGEYFIEVVETKNKKPIKEIIPPTFYKEEFGQRISISKIEQNGGNNNGLHEDKEKSGTVNDSVATAGKNPARKKKGQHKNKKRVSSRS